MSAPAALGYPRLHFRCTDSTNIRARELAAAGAPHGTLVTASEQSAGRGRQGRTWAAPPGRALLCSVVIRDPPRLLPLAAGAAVGELVGPEALIKWPNDVQLGGRKLAGILVEGRPQEGWAVLGIGVNVALRPEDFSPELRELAGTLGRDPGEIESTLARLLELLAHWISAAPADVLTAVRARDALSGKPVQWSGGEGIGAGLDDDGRLLLETARGQVTLDAGEVHLVP